MENVDAPVETTSIPQPERPSYLETYIRGGLDLVKSGKYQEAIEYLRDPKTAQEVGLNFETDARSYAVRKELSEKDADVLADMIAYDSGFNFHNKSIKIADIYTLGPEITGKPQPQISEKLLLDTVLVSLEEWLHGLQFLSHKPIAGYKDREVDVAAYLKNHGVRLTDNFLNRHSRSKYVSQ